MPRWRPTWMIVVALFAVMMTVALVRGAQARADGALMRADPERILNMPALARSALAQGHDGFVQHCASCHGAGGPNQARGVPDLTDGDFLYGTGQVAEIEQIVLHGIRSGDPRGWQLAAMPAYAHAKPYGAEPIPPMTPAQIGDMIQFLRAKHGVATDQAAAARGGKVYAGSGGCYDCHGNDAAGNEAIGAPNLLDDVWLYGGSAATLDRTFREGRAGVSPAYARVLTPVEARAIAVYVAHLARHDRQPAP
ncbi:c-type cytochrome [Sphingomonas bacterium]|uniref:c-type cytochrome n=1 Tax=Sphingomonas bacterium TaxID=1895847 RepID=UPI00157735AC|nr:c-type cytochrome [Sphingomonas bacterium]